MNNNVIEEAINEIVSKLPESDEFKERFKTYLINRLNNNFSPVEMKSILALINIETEE